MKTITITISNIDPETFEELWSISKQSSEQIGQIVEETDNLKIDCSKLSLFAKIFVRDVLAKATSLHCTYNSPNVKDN